MQGQNVEKKIIKTDYLQFNEFSTAENPGLLKVWQRCQKLLSATVKNGQNYSKKINH